MDAVDWPSVSMRRAAGVRSKKPPALTKVDEKEETVYVTCAWLVRENLNVSVLYEANSPDENHLFSQTLDS